jgi:ADP-dependent NAD(P)H-hydrate dehydratase / NAD(P)H-hydrate epimerase
MVKLFSVSEMQSLEKEANQKGLTYATMMENAGQGIAEEIAFAYSRIQKKKAVALVGSGNNGGDALVALSQLALNNWEVSAYIVRKRPDVDPLVSRLINNHGQIIYYDNDVDFNQLNELIVSNSVLIDGVFGTGIKLPIKDDIAQILSFVNTTVKKYEKNLHIVAVDCPSGVDCETGEAAIETIPAEVTITMAGMKTGLLKFPAANLTGEIRIVSIGSIDDLDAYKDNKKTVLNDKTIKEYLPKRPLDSHKGTFGTALIVAGSLNYTGAAFLAGMAAYKIGAGLVAMAVPAPLHNALSGNFPECTWILLPHEMGVISSDAVKVLRKYIKQATALLIGPGFGLEDTTKEFIRNMININNERKASIGFIHDEIKNDENSAIQIPMVVDADGLKHLSKIDKWYELLPSPSILTPHPGEMAVLTELSTQEIQENRIQIAKQYSERWGHVIILKGAYTVIAEPKGEIAIVPVATPALAKAGTGDVLAGLITGLLAQGVEPYRAACTAAYIHANAGLLAAKQQENTASVMASDVLNAIPHEISHLQS